MEHVVYFTDNFFSAGKTSIKDENNQEIGSLDLKSAFSSRVSVLDEKGLEVIRGYFRTFSSQWNVEDHTGKKLGVLKANYFSLKHKFTYTTPERGIYTFSSSAFSRNFSIMDQNQKEVATFKRVERFFSAPAFQLKNRSEQLSSEELIAAIMGVNNLIKQSQSTATTT